MRYPLYTDFVGKATVYWKMLPSLEKAIIPFLRVHILSVKFYTIFMLCITKQYRWPNITFLITFSSTSVARFGYTLDGPKCIPKSRNVLTLLGGLKIHENLLMCDFQVPKCFEYWSFGESVARHGNWIIVSNENTEIRVYFC